MMLRSHFVGLSLEISDLSLSLSRCFGEAMFSFYSKFKFSMLHLLVASFLYCVLKIYIFTFLGHRT